MKKLTIGVIAHVDAGKTTLCEALLYTAGSIRTMGRVDHKNAFLDTNRMERERGITIFSKQARLTVGDSEICLLDTPGHVDFSAEMERTLQVIDYAVLVISGTDGMQAHSETLKYLLEKYRLPLFVFVTKMDREGADKDWVIRNLEHYFGEKVVDFAKPDTEQIAALSEESILEYIDTGVLSDATVRKLIKQQKLIPVYFGSGLRTEGVKEFLLALDRYCEENTWDRDFRARVYKVGKDERMGRLTYLKVTGGTLSVRDTVTYGSDAEGRPVTEKISAIRYYSGEKFVSADSAQAGSICAVCGLSSTYPGQIIGESAGEKEWVPLLQPVMSYRVQLCEGIDPQTAFQKLRTLEEEEPLLRFVWVEEHKEILVHLMGEVQQEILCRLAEERFGLTIALDQGRIQYLETVNKRVEGVGHFEPLRHYAEVHLVLEPGERGSGLVFRSDCSEDHLDRNWQRLILTHLAEKEHRGVLIGAPLTDTVITLIGGRAHPKHTEGGDFRQATYRAVRQGLMQEENVILEPYYRFKLTVPAEMTGRAIQDLKTMYGEFAASQEEDMCVLTGRAPVSTMHNYQKAMIAYTKGRGRLQLLSDGYDICHDGETVIRETAYEPLRDLANTPDSVFCYHGSGEIIPWDKVKQHMHVDTGFGRKEEIPKALLRKPYDIDEKEIEAIMLREFGPIKRPVYAKSEAYGNDKIHIAAQDEIKERIFIDGYNVIFAWDELREEAESSFEDARQTLMDILDNYAGYTEKEIVLVFDGYKVKDSREEKQEYNHIHVVYTKEGESADIYIEKMLSRIGKNERVRIITSDNLIQLTAIRVGISRCGAREFKKEIIEVGKEIDEWVKKK